MSGERKLYVVDISFETNFHAEIGATSREEAYKMVLAKVQKMIEVKQSEDGVTVECDFCEPTWSDVKEY